MLQYADLLQRLSICWYQDRSIDRDILVWWKIWQIEAATRHVHRDCKQLQSLKPKKIRLTCCMMKQCDDFKTRGWKWTPKALEPSSSEWWPPLLYCCQGRFDSCVVRWASAIEENCTTRCDLTLRSFRTRVRPFVKPHDKCGRLSSY